MFKVKKYKNYGGLQDIMNNKLIKRNISICLTVIMMFMCLGLSNAVASSSVDYQGLFSKSSTVDGAYADQLSIDLGKALNADAKLFINALSEQSDDLINKVSELIVYDASFNDLTKFEETVINFKNGKLSDKEVKVLNVILNHINKINADIKASQSLPKVDELKAPAFDSETILNFIKLNKSLNDVDEEFYETLGNAYRLDSKLFAKTIAILSDDDIKAVSKYVAYDCIKKSKKKANLNNSQIMLSDKENSVLISIDSEISNVKNADLKNFISVSQTVYKASTVISPMSTQVPTIGTMTYTTAPLKVGDSENLNVTYSESSSTSTTRTYWTQVYCIRNGTAYLKASKTITISAGYSSTTASYPMTFSSQGPVYTLVKVYSYQGGSLLNSRQGANPDTVTGKWKISVSLPTNRNYKGTLTLYAADGTQQQSNECLGRSASNASMTTYLGNTPTGEYTGYLYGPMTDTAAYGVYKVVNMTGVSGVIISSGRSGIWIHGGRYPYSDTSATWYPLSPTNGCVRISPTNQQALQNKITTLTSSTGYHETTGKISITQY